MRLRPDTKITNLGDHTDEDECLPIVLDGTLAQLTQEVVARRRVVMVEDDRSARLLAFHQANFLGPVADEDLVLVQLPVRSQPLNVLLLVRVIQ